MQPHFIRHYHVKIRWLRPNFHSRWPNHSLDPMPTLSKSVWLVQHMSFGRNNLRHSQSTCIIDLGKMKPMKLLGWICLIFTIHSPYSLHPRAAKNHHEPTELLKSAGTSWQSRWTVSFVKTASIREGNSEDASTNFARGNRGQVVGVHGAQAKVQLLGWKHDPKQSHGSWVPKNCW